MRGTLAAEVLALSTGLFPRRPPTAVDVKRAQNLHARAASAIKAFIGSEGAEPVQWERPPEQETLHADLLAPLPMEQWAQHPDHAVSEEIFAQWGLVLEAARKTAADTWPTYDADELVPANYALSSDELGDVWEVVRALDGTKGFFDDLAAHCLSPAQVTAARAAYPDWFESLDHIMFEALTDAIASKRTLTWQQEDQVRVFRGLPDEAPLNAPPQAQQQAPAKTGQVKSIRQLRTKDERMESAAQEAK